MVIQNSLEENVIKGNDVMLLTDINSQYQALVRKIGGQAFHDAQPSTQKLKLKIINHFGDQIKIEKGRTKHGNIVHKTSMSTEEAFRKHSD